MTHDPATTATQTSPTGVPTPEGAPVGLPPAFTTPQFENVLTLDRIMASAQRARRTARICLRGDLEGEYVDTLEKLAELVDAEGNLLAEDPSMTEVAEVTELRDRAAQLREQMAADTYSVVFEGMFADEWAVFEKEHRDTRGAVKDLEEYRARLIAACAVSPKLSYDDVQAMRSRLRTTQMVELGDQAYAACSTGGVDVPKLPLFWHSPRQQESSLS